MDLSGLQNRFPNLDVRRLALAELTSFRIGGQAAVAFPGNARELRELLQWSAETDTKFRILGAGTNILAPDSGISDLIICTRGLDGEEPVSETVLRAGAGLTMTRLAIAACNRSLTGLEFAHGIPGTVGGGVYMNAGAYGGEIGNICIGAHVMSGDGTVGYMPREELAFSYRHSSLEGTDLTVISADFQLQPGNQEEIRGQMQALMERRKSSQPLNMPSAGSAFKRPEKGYAAALIDETGLKGYAVGGAMVSPKHAGFVVNTGNATSSDVQALLRDVAEKVFARTGILLEPEVRIW